jgi:ribose-phosphate pyrophosphokinase
MLLALMRPLLIAAPGDAECAGRLAGHCDAEVADLTVRYFPDGEVYVRVETPVRNRDVWVVCTLYPPSEKLHTLFLLASTARDLGARRVALLAPYLAYLRQDSRFRPGEGITSAYVARWLSNLVDEVVTIDPHLHRYRSLSEVYSVPARVISAAPAIAHWLRDAVQRPVIIGPDMESAQWAEALAAELACPVLIFEKIRRGDRDVSVSRPDSDTWRELASGTPILLDDIISTGHTMIEALRALGDAAEHALCVGIHAIFADEEAGRVEAQIQAAGARQVLTCNTIPHPTNKIDVSALLAAALSTSSAS